MKNKDLIAALQKLDPETEVCVFDWKMNMINQDDEGSSIGVYDDFKVEIMDGDEIPEGSKPWIALTVENSFIDEDFTMEMFLEKLSGKE